MEAIAKAVYTKELPNGASIDWMVTKIDPDEVIRAPREDIDLVFLSPEAQLARMEARFVIQF